MNSYHVKMPTLIEISFNAVLGASSGIGQRLAIEYARYGPYLALTGRSAERLEETKKLCIDSGLKDSNVSLNMTFCFYKLTHRLRAWFQIYWWINSLQIYLITGDVTVKDDIERIMSSVVSHFGKLDILVSIKYLKCIFINRNTTFKSLQTKVFTLMFSRSTMQERRGQGTLTHVRLMTLTGAIMSL